MGQYTITLSDEAEQGLAHIVSAANAKAAETAEPEVTAEQWVQQQVEAIGLQRHNMRQRIAKIRAKVLAGEKITPQQFQVLTEASRQGL